MSNITFDNGIGYIEHAQVAVSFQSSDMLGRSKNPVVAPVRHATLALKVAPWGEDNRFPQNIVNSLSKCGIAQRIIKTQTENLYGGGLIYGKVIDIDAGGNEVFQVAKPGEFPEVDAFFDENNIPLYFAEYGMDYFQFANAFPEIILSKDKKKIVGIIIDEACDCRISQHDESGNSKYVYISKLWGADGDQFVKFDPTKSMSTFYNSKTITASTQADGKYIIERRLLDRYFSLESLKKQTEKHSDLNYVLPLNFPSANKTYYQLASWDGARLSGWIEIASKVPQMLQSLYKNAFNIRYHIEIPSDYFQKKFGTENWNKFTEEEQSKAQKEVLESINKVLTGSDNAYKSLITMFDVSKMGENEVGRVKIQKIDAKNDTSSDLLTSGTANSEIAVAFGINPNTLGMGKPGGVYSSNQGGSNIREGKLEADSRLTLDRQIALEPFRLIAKYNGWPKELKFAFKDTVLLTLDSGKQTETKIN